MYASNGHNLRFFRPVAPRFVAVSGISRIT
jgi:hypothetical protein